MIVFLWKISKLDLRYRSEISSYMINRKFVAPTTKFRFQFGEENFTESFTLSVTSNIKQNCLMAVFFKK